MYQKTSLIFTVKKKASFFILRAILIFFFTILIILEVILLDVQCQKPENCFLRGRIDCPNSPLVFCFREFLFRWGWDLRKKKETQGRGNMNSSSTFYVLFCLHSMRNHSPKTVKKTNSNHLACFFFGEILFLCKQS